MNHNKTSITLYKIVFVTLFFTCIAGCGGGGTQRIAPVIEISSPASLDNLTGLAIITGKAIPQTGFTITKLTYQIDALAIKNLPPQVNWTIQIDTTHLPPGTHKLKISATDNSDEVGVFNADFSIAPTIGADPAILSALRDVQVADVVNISGQLDNAEGWRFTYYTANESGTPVKCGGWAMKPPGFGPFPTVIYCPGGVGGNANPETLLEFAQLGLVVFATDYQGEGDFAASVKPDLLGTEVYDVIAILNLARRMPFVDRNNLFIRGDSRGSAVALLTLDRLSWMGRAGEVKGAAVTNTIYDIEQAIIIGIDDVEMESVTYFMALKNLTYDEALNELKIRAPGFSINHDDIVTPMFIGHSYREEGFKEFHSESLQSDMAAQGVLTEYKFYSENPDDPKTQITKWAIYDIAEFWLSL